MQIMLTVFYFVFTIICTASFNGWTVLGKTNKCSVDKPNNSAYRFVAFFTVCENLLYYLCMTLGLHSVHMMHY